METWIVLAIENGKEADYRVNAQNKWKAMHQVTKDFPDAQVLRAVKTDHPMFYYRG